MTGAVSQMEAAPLAGKVAVVTGASSGIGRAIAVALAENHASIVAVGRNRAELDKTVGIARLVDGVGKAFEADLLSKRAIGRLERELQDQFGQLDILIHSAGIIAEARMSEARVRDLDRQYLANVRVPWVLSQAMLPLLKASRGQIVFLNSSAGVSAKRADFGQYAATHHAMKAIADSLREEVNAHGVRVLSIYPGRTATPRQEVLHQKAGKKYRPELLMQPDDVARMVVAALSLPPTAEVTDLHMRPMIKS
jgi:NADP-dependent 3-hydroxy acid dehydrogenase YdfG